MEEEEVVEEFEEFLFGSLGGGDLGGVGLDGLAEGGAFFFKFFF